MNVNSLSLRLTASTDSSLSRRVCWHYSLTEVHMVLINNNNNIMEYTITIVSKCTVPRRTLTVVSIHKTSSTRLCNQFKVKVTQLGKLKRLEPKAFVYKYFVCFRMNYLAQWSHKERDWLYPHKQATPLYRRLGHQRPQDRQWPSHDTRLLDNLHQARDGKVHPTMQETKHSGAVDQHHKIPNATHQQIRGLTNINRNQIRVRKRHLCNYGDCYGNCWSE